ncbi:heme NO-binding domain-containing protein [Marinobacter fonticola]|uniref:heme NO-binding domain-containing protein n=1 Tax=Marinobacter fonticola TaxID=2603215 RepID=UPI0011E89B4F|nr:heme NO-binding domain-containing protein [Marinobacter fonticola]
MIGLIQKVLVDLIRRHGGDDAVQAICRRADVPPERAFRIDTDYADTECLRLIEATGEYFGLDEKALYRLYADQFIKETKALFPMFYQMSPSAREFLKRQPRVHDTLASSLRSAPGRDRVRDKFNVEEVGDTLRVTYRSPNRLCGLYEALFERLLDEYGETGSIEVTSCQKRGDPLCTFCLRVESSGE